MTVYYGTEGFWISPEGEPLEVREHFEAIQDDPTRFGFTRREASRWKPEDRELVLRQAIGKGWIRVRGHRTSTTFDVDELTDKAVFEIGEHLKRLGVWDEHPIKVHETRHGTVTHEMAGWILSGAALAAARNPRRS